MEYDQSELYKNKKIPRAFGRNPELEASMGLYDPRLLVKTKKPEKIEVLHPEYFIG